MSDRKKIEGDHRPAADLYHGTRLPAHVLDGLLGIGMGPPPFVWPGERPPREGPYMRVRPPERDALDRRGTWEIVDRTTRLEERLLGRAPRDRVESTGCKVGDEEGAVRAYAIFAALRRALLLASVLPSQLDAGDVLRAFATYLGRGGHSFKATTGDFYFRHLPPLLAFFDGRLLGEIGNDVFDDYADWRTSQDSRRGGPGAKPENRPKVGRKTARHEVNTFRRAVSAFEEMARTKLGFGVHRPSAPRARVVWLDRGQAARYLWALRGRTWHPGEGRFRIRRDDDPSLDGPEGNLHVLRPPDVVARRRAMARVFLASIYSGGRVRSILGTSYDDDAGAHVEWFMGALARKGVQEDESLKRRGTVLLPAKFMGLLRNWARNDMARGIRHMVHKPDGKPYARQVATRHWRLLDDDAGLGLHFTPHVGRHTCAHWLKHEGVSLWLAADFLDCSPLVLREFYGKWDLQGQVAAAAALSGRSRQREALRGLRADRLA